ncbi:MAG: prolipoprotein diacylglyceryl transferase [Clostridiaceae bacterium]|nr:prolipoprotein diacylglyceryl transferase [Clostridiaceae bacterium]
MIGGITLDYVEFPKLGIHIEISPIIVENVFGTQLDIRWYGLFIAFAMFLSLIIGMKQSKKYNIEEEDLIDMFLVALPFAVIFARLFFVVFTWDNFKNDLLGIFRIWEGGLAIYGGLIGAVGAVLLFCKKRKMDVLNLFDFACVYLPLSQAIGRLGNFTNQELYGTYTDLPWGMTGSRIGDIPVHPAFLYEFVFNLIIFLILLKLRKNKKVKGSVFATYLMSYSLIRFLLEFIRTDEFGTGNIRYNQVVAAAVFVLSFIWLIYLIIRSKRSEGLPAESESPEGLDTEFDNLAAEKEDNQDTVEDKGLI